MYNDTTQPHSLCSTAFNINDQKDAQCKIVRPFMIWGAELPSPTVIRNQFFLMSCTTSSSLSTCVLPTTPGLCLTLEPHTSACLSSPSSVRWMRLQKASTWRSKAVESAALEAASSRTRGSGWAPSGPASSWEYRAAQSRQARPEEAQEPSWDAAKGALWRSCATSEAATLCGGGCNPMWRRVQHYVAGAATLFGRAARRWSPRGRAG